MNLPFDEIVFVTPSDHLIKNEKEAYFIAFGKEFEMINDEKRPLSKFTRDILENLKMLNILKVK